MWWETVVTGNQEKAASTSHNQGEGPLIGQTVIRELSNWSAGRAMEVTDQTEAVNLP